MNLFIEKKFGQPKPTTLYQKKNILKKKKKKKKKKKEAAKVETFHGMQA